MKRIACALLASCMLSGCAQTAGNSQNADYAQPVPASSAKSGNESEYEYSMDYIEQVRDIVIRDSTSFTTEYSLSYDGEFRCRDWVACVPAKTAYDVFAFFVSRKKERIDVSDADSRQNVVCTPSIDAYVLSETDYNKLIGMLDDIRKGFETQ